MEKRPFINEFLRLATIVAGFTIAMPLLAWAKPVVVRWEKIERAVFYDLEIRTTENEVKRVQSLVPEWKGDLQFGAYSVRVRAVDRVKRPGFWTEWKALIALPPPPEIFWVTKERTEP